MTDIIVAAVVVLIVALALFYVIREKKKGNKCIGCPYSSSCTKNSCSDKK